MNYGQLKALIASTAHRSDLATQIPGFIAQAEDMIANNLRSFDMEISADLTDLDRTTIDGAAYKMPTDFLEMISFAQGIGSKVRVELRSLSFEETTEVSHAKSRQRSPVGNGAIGYTIVKRNILVFPAPPLGNEFALLYYARLPALTLDADTNLLLTNQSSIYLYAALKHLGIYVQDMELSQLYDELFFSTADRLNTQSDRHRNAGPAVIQGASQWV